MTRQICGVAVLTLMLATSSGGCGRKGPPKPLKQQPPGYTLSEVQ